MGDSHRDSARVGRWRQTMAEENDEELTAQLTQAEERLAELKVSVSKKDKLEVHFDELSKEVTDAQLAGMAMQRKTQTEIKKLEGILAAGKEGVQSFVEETEKELQRLIEENSNLEAKLAKRTLEADQAAEALTVVNSKLEQVAAAHVLAESELEQANSAMQASGGGAEVEQLGQLLQQVAELEKQIGLRRAQKDEEAKELKTLENQLKKEEHNLAQLNDEIETSPTTSPSCRFSTSFGASRRVTELRRKLLDEVYNMPASP